jgi:hypothetical protein
VVFQQRDEGNLHIANEEWVLAARKTTFRFWKVMTKVLRETDGITEKLDVAEAYHVNFCRQVTRDFETDAVWVCQ